MTIKEYNETIHRNTSHADVFICTLEHAMQKTGHYEEAMHQLRCSGWSEEVKDTIRKALTVYRNLHKREAQASARAAAGSDPVQELIAQLRKMGLSNGSSLGHHCGAADEAADLIESYLHEEQAGKLLRLPCAVGDTVYKICPQSKSLQMGMMWSGKVITGTCERCPWRNCDCSAIGFQNDDAFEHIVNPIVVTNLEWLVHRLPHFGSVYFTSEADAQKALENLETVYHGDSRVEQSTSSEVDA